MAALLDIVPSRHELSWTVRNRTGKKTLLPRFVAKVEIRYELINIDGSPTDSSLTDAAYHCSRYMLVKIRAEFLASIGFSLLDCSVKASQMRLEDSVIEVSGLVCNDYARRECETPKRACTEGCEPEGCAIRMVRVPERYTALRFLFQIGQRRHADQPYKRDAWDGNPSDSTRMSFLSWGDIFTLPLGGDRIMELKQTAEGGCPHMQPSCYTF